MLVKPLLAMLVLNIMLLLLYVAAIVIVLVRLTLMKIAHDLLINSYPSGEWL
jgi:hypothetical protein